MTRRAGQPLTDSVEPDVVVARRHPGRWAAAAVIMAALAAIIHAFAVAPSIEWSAVKSNLFHPTILQGLVVTVELAIVCELLAFLFGIALAVMRLSGNPVLFAFAQGYAWFFRGVPLIVQLIFIYNLSLIFPQLSIGVPFTHFWISADTNKVISGFSAAILGLTLADAAQLAEIIRAGISSIPKGQSEAAAALGVNGRNILWRIVLPQAMRFIIPPTGNNFIQLLKATSLVSVIAGADLMTSAQAISARTYQVVELLMVATFWYLLLVSIATVGQYHLEKYFARQDQVRRQPEPLT